MLDDCKKGDLISVSGIPCTVTKVYKNEDGSVWKVTCKLNGGRKNGKKNISN